MPAKCDVLISGTGAFAERLAFDLAAAAPDPIQIAIAGRNKQRVAWIAHTANARAAIFGRSASFSGHGLSWTSAETIAETLDELTPTIVVQTASIQSPWSLLDASGSRWAAFVERLGGLGAVGFLQALLTMRMAQAVALHGNRARLVNACYPDLVNRLVAIGGFPIECGLGNVGILAAWFAAEEGVRTPGSLKLLAHHQHLVMYCRTPAERRGVPPRAWLCDQELGDVEGRYADLHIPRRPTVNSLAGATAVPVVLALVGFRAYQGCVPGPLGLTGGYPITIHGGRVAFDLPPGLSLEDAKTWFQQFEAQEPLALAETGRVIFNNKAVEELSLHLPEYAKGFEISQLEEVCGAMVQLRDHMCS